MRPSRTNHSTSITHLAISALTCCALNAHAISLDDAVTAQLENVPGFGVCARLLNAGADPIGNLLDICSRAAPAGATPGSSGGGSATPTAIPSNNSGFLEDTETPDESTVAISGQWSLFFTAENESLDRKARGTEGAFDSTIERLVVGSSFAPRTNMAFSVAADISQHEGKFNNGGDFSFDNTGLRFLGAFNPSDKLSLFIAAAYDQVSADRRRLSSFEDIDSGSGVAIFSASGAPETSYDYNQLGLALHGAYEFTAGRLSLSPQFGIDWLNSDYGNYRERGDSGLELRFHNDEKSSLQSALGLEGTFAVATRYGAFIPQVSLTWRHEFDSDARNIEVSFVEDLNGTRFQYQADALDENFFELSAGSVFVLQSGMQLFVNLQTLLSHEVYDSVIASAGLRIEL